MDNKHDETNIKIVVSIKQKNVIKAGIIVSKIFLKERSYG